MTRYVLDTSALIAAERGKARAARFVRLAEVGSAQLVVPLPVIAEWWRGRSAVRERLLAACAISGSITAMKTAGVALAREADVDAKLTIDATVIATAALLDAVVITADTDDFTRLRQHFPGVVVLGC